MTKIKVEGMRELEQNFDKFVRDFSGPEIKEIVKSRAQIFADSMKSHVRENTGRLKSSIKVIDGGAQFPQSVIVGPEFDISKSGTMTIAALASVQEFGAGEREASTRRTRKGGKVRYNEQGEPYKRVLVAGQWKTMGRGEKAFNPIPARPFIRPAFDANRATVEKKIKDDLIELANKKAKNNNLK